MEASFSVSLSRVKPWLIVIPVLLAAAHFAGLYLTFGLGYNHAKGFVPMFNLDTEYNAPSWYSAALLLACAIALFQIAKERRGASVKEGRYWAGLGFLFVFLSFDETVALHERLNEVVGLFVAREGVLLWPWILVYGTAALVLGALYSRFLWRLPRSTAKFIVLSGVLYVGGAAGLEMVGAFLVDSSGSAEELLIQCVAAVEELLEIAGVQLFFYTLLSYMVTHLRRTPASVAELKSAALLSS